MVDESDSWSLVDAEDEASRDRPSGTSSSEFSAIDALGKALQELCFPHCVRKPHSAVMLHSTVSPLLLDM